MRGVLELQQTILYVNIHLYIDIINKSNMNIDKSGRYKYFCMRLYVYIRLCMCHLREKFIVWPSVHFINFFNCLCSFFFANKFNRSFFRRMMNSTHHMYNV